MFDGDIGPNTGGMGAYSPAPVMTAGDARRDHGRDHHADVARHEGDAARRSSGVLYAGIMLTTQGPKLIEYNVRFGDPECQVLMLRMMSDIVPALLACVRRAAEEFRPALVSTESALTVVMAAKGYPGDYGKGTRDRGAR